MPLEGSCASSMAASCGLPSSRPRQSQSKTVNTCPNWARAELRTEQILCGSVKNQIHQKAVNMRHQPTKVTRTISIYGALTQRKEKEKRGRVRKRKDNGCKCGYCKSLSQEYVSEAHAIRNFQEHPLESKGKPGANGTIQNAHERHSYPRTETPVRKDKHNFSHQSLKREQYSATDFHL